MTDFASQVLLNDLMLKSIAPYMAGETESKLTGDAIVARGYWDFLRAHAPLYSFTQAAMQSAAEQGQLETCKWLKQAHNLKATAEVMDAAAQFGHISVVQWCIDAGTRPSDAAVACAAETGDLELVERFIRAGGPLTERAIAMAAWFGKENVVRTLLKGFADQPAPRVSEWVLQWAAANGSEPCVRALLEHGVRATAVAVMAALSHKHLDVVKLLCANNKGSGEVINKSVTAWASSIDDPAFLKAVLQHGSQVSPECVFIAGAYGFEESVRALVEAGAVIEDPALIITARHGHTNVLDYLAQKVTTMPYKCWESAARYGIGWASILWAIEKYHIELRPSLIVQAIKGKQDAYARRLVKELGVVPTLDCINAAASLMPESDLKDFLQSAMVAPTAAVAAAPVTGSAAGSA